MKRHSRRVLLVALVCASGIVVAQSLGSGHDPVDHYPCRLTVLYSPAHPEQFAWQMPVKRECEPGMRAALAWCLAYMTQAETEYGSTAQP